MLRSKGIKANRIWERKGIIELSAVSPCVFVFSVVTGILPESKEANFGVETLQNGLLFAKSLHGFYGIDVDTIFYKMGKIYVNRCH